MKLLRLNEILRERQLTSKELADKLDLTPTTISRISTGKTFPSGDLLFKMAEILDVDIKDLFYSTKNYETLYVKREGEFISVGEILIDSNSK